MRVLVVTGSSGGHIFPALALVDSLKATSNQILLVLPQKSKENKIFPQTDCNIAKPNQAAGVEVKYIHTVNLDLSLSKKNISGAYFFLLAAWESLRMIMKFKPDVVVGFGSLNTVALIFWAWLFRINTIIHEQNVVPGRANRLLAKLADKVAISFILTSSYLKVSREKIILTGNPIRKDLVKLDRKEALDFFKFKEGKFNILITGGSQGSHKLNTVCLAAFSACPVKNDLQVIHISGPEDFALLKQAYADSGITYKVFDFFSPMQYAYSVADLVICRSGATTIAELQRFSLPALLIPYPFAYAHQLNNARILEDSGSALIIRDEELSSEKISDKLLEFLEDPQKLKIMRQAYAKSQVLDATSLLTNEVLCLN